MARKDEMTYRGDDRVPILVNQRRVAKVARLAVFLDGIALLTPACRDFAPGSEQTVPAPGAGGERSSPQGGGSGSPPQDEPSGGGEAALAESGKSGQGDASQNAGASGAAGTSQIEDGGQGGQKIDLPNDSAHGGAAGASDLGVGGHESDSWGGQPASLPSCTLGDPFETQSTRALAISHTYNGVGLQLYSWESQASAMLVRWSDAIEPTKWVDWRCFDVAPNITRVAAMNLLGGWNEVLVVSDDDVLLVRRETGAGWSAWQVPFNLPSTVSRISDIAAVAAPPPDVNVAASVHPCLYIVDRGQVVARCRTGDDMHSGYGPWQALPKNGARLLAAFQRADGAQQVVTTDSEGRVETARREPGAPIFSDWAPLPSLSVTPVDFEATDSATLGTVSYALDADGLVWELVGGGPATAWVSRVSQQPARRIVAIALDRIAGEPRLFGNDVDGRTYELVGAQWRSVAIWE